MKRRPRNRFLQVNICLGIATALLTSVARADPGELGRLLGSDASQPHEIKMGAPQIPGPPVPMGDASAPSRG